MQAISDFKSKMAKYHVSYVMTTSWETEDEQKVRVHLGGSITTVLDLLVYTVRCLPKLKELTTLNKLDFMLGMTTELRDLFNDVKKILMDDND